MNQDPHTNSSSSSIYVSLKNELREFGRRSKHFLSGDQIISLILLTVSLDGVLVLLGEN